MRLDFSKILIASRNYIVHKVFTLNVFMNTSYFMLLGGLIICSGHAWFILFSVHQS